MTKRTAFTLVLVGVGLTIGSIVASPLPLWVKWTLAGLFIAGIGKHGMEA